jgi:hypothetical protein
VVIASCQVISISDFLSKHAKHGESQILGDKIVVTGVDKRLERIWKT